VRRLPLRRRRRRWHERLWAEERRTLGIGALAAASVGAVIAGEVGRVWKRGDAPLPSETTDLIGAAEVAALETVEVARAGYNAAPERQNALFNLLVSFVASFAIARGVTFTIRHRETVGPFRNLRVGRRHIHHYVPGIILTFVSGAVAIVTSDESIEPKLALVFGTGMGLTLDESALLLDLEDVYWTEEGVLSVQITLAVAALLGAIALGLRFLARGEQLVLNEAVPDQS
jgi:hypothetical protein